MPTPPVPRPAAFLLTCGLACCAAATCASPGSRSTPAAAPPDPRPSAPAGVILDDRVQTYPVRGRTVSEVRESLTASAPDATGARYRGLHNATLIWQWRATPGGTALGCELRDVIVTVRSTIIVPAWVPDSAAEPGLAAQWASYAAALRRHERGHEALATEAAGTLLRALRHVRANDCAHAASDGSQTAREILGALQVAEARYDDSTAHGHAQGAFWPPPPSAPPTVDGR